MQEKLGGLSKVTGDINGSVGYVQLSSLDRDAVLPPNVLLFTRCWLKNFLYSFQHCSTVCSKGILPVVFTWIAVY